MVFQEIIKYMKETVLSYKQKSFPHHHIGRIDMF